MQVELINSLCKNGNIKKAGNLIKRLNLNIDDFPRVKEGIVKNSMKYYLGNYLYKKPAHKRHMNLAKIEDLFTGHKQIIAYLVEALAHAGKKNEAVGIMKRNQVEDYLNPYAKQWLKDEMYDEAGDTSIRTYDAFEPLSQPKENYISLPDTVKVEWIGSE